MATATFDYYLQGRKNVYNGVIGSFTANTFKVALLTGSYTPSLGTHEFFSDITNEVTGTGYTAGGVTVASRTLTATAANSWGTTWAASTAYNVGDVVRPTTGNTYIYYCTTAGTSSGTQPTWPTVRGDEVTDGSVKWCNVGTAILVFDADDPAWTSSTIASVAYGVLYKSTGTASTSPLIGLLTLSSTISSSSGTLSIPLHATLGFLYDVSA